MRDHGKNLSPRPAATGAPLDTEEGGEQKFWLEQLSRASAYNDWIASLVVPHLSGTVLEVGCGVGNYTPALAAHADRVIGLDLHPGFVEAARRATAGLGNVELRCADVFAVDLEQPVDTIVMLDVLEHLEHDVEVLQRLRGLLVPGGRIVLKVPALQALYNDMDRAIGHYRRYGRRRLRSVLQQAGFQDIRLRAFNLPGIFGWWFDGAVLNRQTPPSGHIGGFNRLVPLLRLVERIVPPPVGLSLFAVASKPG